MDSAADGAWRGLLRAVKLLVCIYTCAADAPARATLEASALLKYLRDDARCTVVDVTADPALFEPRVTKEGIIVPCPESYTSLSLKTWHMIDAACTIDFDFLLKVDATLAQYAERPHAKSAEVLAALSPEAALAALENPEFFSRAYAGLVRQTATREGFEIWLQTKGIDGNYAQVFGAQAETPPYYLGKCYALRRDFCEFIATHGKSMALEHARWLGGSEDLMVGRLYAAWQDHQRRLLPRLRRLCARLIRGH